MDLKTKEGLEKALKEIEEENKTSTTLNDYQKMRRLEGLKEVHEMLQQPYSREEMENQILRSRGLERFIKENNNKEMDNKSIKKHFCPICNAELQVFARYPKYVCRDCVLKATDSNGRALIFGNPYPLGHGFAAKYADTGEEYDSRVCYIDGVECRAAEARFGGIVVETVEKPTKIVNLNDYAKYRKLLKKVTKRIDTVYDAVYESLFDIACAGKWKEWDEQQPIGTVFDLSEEMLRDTGDTNIDLLWEILDKIDEVKEKMTIWGGGLEK